MARVSLSQAAKDTGVSLPTLSRWRKSGKITADKNGSGGYIIDTSEYDRINDLMKQSPNKKGVSKGFIKHAETPNEMKVLQVEVEVLRERIKDKESFIEEIREDRDEWKKQAQTLLLQKPVRAEKHTSERENSISATPLPKGNKSTTEKQNDAGYNLILLLTLFLLIIFGMTLANNFSLDAFPNLRHLF